MVLITTVLIITGKRARQSLHWMTTHLQRRLLATVIGPSHLQDGTSSLDYGTSLDSSTSVDNEGSQLHEGSSFDNMMTAGGGGSNVPTPSSHTDPQRSIKSVQRDVQMGRITPRSGEPPYCIFHINPLHRIPSNSPLLLSSFTPSHTMDVSLSSSDHPCAHLTSPYDHLITMTIIGASQVLQTFVDSLTRTRHT